MLKLLALLGSMIAIAFTLFIAAPLSALVGAFAGWTVSLTPLGDMIQKVIGDGFTLPQLGTTLGFVGAFFRSTSSTKKD